MVVGETGSGKTSTIHALANAMTRCNRNSKESSSSEDSGSSSSGGHAALPAVQVSLCYSAHITEFRNKVTHGSTLLATFIVVVSVTCPCVQWPSRPVLCTHTTTDLSL